ncbi:MAG: ABC transporter ATP-binding protein [Syntrophales bacterium]|nr:ABC transporter ATP-binding protein [Syntrophales bacterium]
MGAAIKIDNLTKTFVKDGLKIEVLKGINFTVSAGESLAVAGVSGAGKSTLIHIIGALDRPTSGSVLVDGVDVFNWEEKKLARFRNEKIGFIFQFFNLLPEFTSLENTMMPALLQGKSRREAKERAEIILNEVGLGDRMNHQPGELSGGEQQRVAVARALIMKPDIILADEPTGNLDRSTGVKIEDILVNLNKTREVTLIVVTHNKSLADKMSRSIGLGDGRICASE